MSGQDLQNLLENIQKNGRLKNQIKEDRADYDPGENKVGVFYKTARHLPTGEYLELKKEIERFSTRDVSVTLTQADFAAELLSDAAALEKNVKDFCALKQPAIAPFLPAAEVRMEGGRLLFAFGDGMAMELFQTMRLKDALQTYLSQAYGIEAPVHLSVSEAANGSYEFPDEVADAIEKRAEKRKMQAAVPKAEGAPAPRARKTAGKDAVTSVEHLQAGEKCTIDGEVVFTESQTISNGEMTKHRFVVCDYTGSVTCFFIDSVKYPSKLELPRKGSWVRVDGKYDYDNYAHENLMKASRIRESGHVFRADKAPRKRVELHAHTQMSAQDAVSPVKDIVARAAKWGHKAVAITDHGVVQAFPDAEKAAKAAGIKVIYGVEGYLVDDAQNVCGGADMAFEDEYVVFDIETTGLSPVHCDITEIGAVRVVGGEIKDSFHTFVKPSAPIPPKITSLTGITDDMVKNAPPPGEALAAFRGYCGEDAILAAHNADFDTRFVFGKGREAGIAFPHRVVDTLKLCRLAFPGLSNHKLDTVAKHLKLPLHHHRASDDAECTARILLKCFGAFRELGAGRLSDIDRMEGFKQSYKHTNTSHVILLAQNKRGLRNLYKLVSHAHVDYFYRRPRMPKSLIESHREGLIIGSACESGELYSAVVAGASDEKLRQIASFYDYLEIQPRGNNEFLVRKGVLSSEEDILTCNKKIVELGERMGKPVAAACDVHFLDPHGEYFRRIIFKVQGYDDTQQAPLYLRTTEEMLEEFSYLGKEKAFEVVVENTNAIADSVEEIELFQDETAMPQIENASEYITELAYKTAKEAYGDPLPEIVEARLKRELESIVGHGFSVLYYSAHKLVKKSLEDGYLVGSRGSVGSSLAATMTGITEVNPLPPHYVCPECNYSDFEVDSETYACGVDLPEKNCPKCGAHMKKEGYDIPFEVFLGIDADKVPDIDLNFSGEYQATAHKYTEELFGKGHVFRAGTISAIQDKIAYGYVKKYLEETGTTANEAEVNRLKEGISGVKKTTGQHPGGMVIVPHDREVYEFTPVQRPADKQDAEFITTHFDFNSMHDILIKLDILGHDVPTIIRLLQDMTGVDPLQIPLDDPETMGLFSSLEPLGLSPTQLLGIKMGTLGVPEFGTKFVRQMLADTMPTTMAELVRISGLSHGTDVWLGNAQELIQNGVCTLKQAICTRDDIMNYLVAKGVDKRTAFFIMEATRKGQVAKKGFSDDQQQALEEAGIPEWFIESCRKIKYMFPKAHAVAYTIMSMRIAYMKVHHKEAFYASYFTANAGKFDGSAALEGLEGLKKKWREIEERGNNVTANEKDMGTMLEVACEMYLRGVHFLPVDLEKSDAVRYQIEKMGIRMPFLAVPKLGDTAAKAIVDEREKEPFLSVEDFKKRTRCSAAVIAEMHKMGTLTGMAETNQISLFD